MARQIATFLMFEGRAGEAIELYASLFDDAEIHELTRYEAGDPVGKEGTVMRASFTLAGQRFMAFDSGISHGFGFTPATSIFVACDSPEEVDRLYEALSDGGEVMMPLGAYPFSPRYAWLADRFGVSRQLAAP